MTPEQLEQAARHYCKLMGENPETLIYRDGWGGTPKVDVVKHDIRAYWAMNEALKEGMRDPKVDEIVSAMFPIGRP